MEKTEIIQILEKQLQLLSEASIIAKPNKQWGELAELSAGMNTVAKLLLEYNQRPIPKKEESDICQQENGA